MSDYCDACCETLTYIGRKVRLCPKHAVVDELLNVAKKTTEELKRLHAIHAPKYEGKLGEPDLEIIRYAENILAEANE